MPELSKWYDHRMTNHTYLVWIRARTSAKMKVLHQESDGKYYYFFTTVHDRGTDGEGGKRRVVIIFCSAHCAVREYRNNNYGNYKDLLFFFLY
jgi:hypothetical protein